MTEFWIILIIVAAICCAIGVILDRVLNPWLAQRWVKKSLQKIKEGKVEPSHFDFTITWDSDGFFVEEDKTGQKSPRMAWADVAKVTAFKRDLWTTDCIFLFLAGLDETGLELHEEMNGWSKFIEELPTFLSGCQPPSTWLWNVAMPAFKSNVTEIFSRPVKHSTIGGTV